MGTQVQAKRSGFVTVIAWIFIVLAGFALFYTLIQGLMISYVYTDSHIHKAMQAAEHAQNMPAISRLFIDHMQLFNVIFMVLSTAMLIISIALLKRKNWARIGFIAFMAIGIIWNVFSLVMQAGYFNHMPPLPQNTPPQYHDQMKMMQTGMLIFSAVLAIVFSILFAWIIKRLLSVKYKAEFTG